MTTKPRKSKTNPRVTHEKTPATTLKRKLNPMGEASEIVKASAIIKRYASKQKIVINLTPSQERAILKQWNDKDPHRPAEIIFKVRNKPVVDLKVAAYRYRGDTCCV